MVLIQKDSTKRKSAFQRCYWQIPLFTGIAVVFWMIITLPEEGQHYEVLADPTVLRKPRQEEQGEASVKKESHASITSSCPYTSLSDLTESELHPRADSRHMVTPPDDQDLTLVCCETTAGPWSILVHHAWAPNGAGRFLDMVRSDYFNDQKVPLMRCIHNFLCQFGLAGSASRNFAETLVDDPNWLPEGKEHRENKEGVKRFARGYVAYAGGGQNSRNNQFIVALKGNGPLAGGSPWEVPWGELVGDHSFETLSKIYTGYGEKGPRQGRLWKEDYLELVEKDFPHLDLINSCHIVDEKKTS
jgi:peptidyl-prolyl cis-trans isomerase A (cyclophilin A)